jgi:hypothetical protein
MAHYILTELIAGHYERFSGDQQNPQAGLAPLAQPVFGRTGQTVAPVQSPVCSLPVAAAPGLSTRRVPVHAVGIGGPVPATIRPL